MLGKGHEGHRSWTRPRKGTLEQSLAAATAEAEAAQAEAIRLDLLGRKAGW
jgi:hypothetical protein